MHVYKVISIATIVNSNQWISHCHCI